MTQSIVRLRGLAFLLVAALLVASPLLWTGCDKSQEPATSPEVGSPQVLLKAPNDHALRAVMDVQNRATPGLMKNPNVVGTATGLSDNGTPVILIFLKNDPSVAHAPQVPSAIENVSVVAEVTGEIKAFADHKVKQVPPVQMGTSGGWRYDLANGYCCSGTLGSLVQRSGSQFILSNYHVFWGDITLGGNNRVATAGDYVIQPGLVDINCNANNAQNVATLSDKGSLPNSNVDAGIAQVISGMVRTDGAILDVGTISASTVGASLNQAVKKSGRTTGLTRSQVTGLNGTISVTYDNECAGGTAFTKTFTGQIIVKNNGSRFLNSGDSGSLMVEDVATNPRAVGLLYAGSSRLAIANPINEVLSFFGATMVGK